MFDRILIANRGEIAVRVARTCRELGVEVVAVFSDVDERALHVALADEAVHLPGVAPADTYLNAAAIIDVARRTGAQGIHPGYGFLAESAEFARAVADAGMTWVGPPPDALALSGNKVDARRLAERAGVPIVPGLVDPVADADEVVAFGRTHGFPLAIKAAAGGGGRGLRVVHAADEVPAALATARREGKDYFGSDAAYVERYLEHPKHVEIQILAPRPGEALWLGARDCSLQRRHQKLVEETPPPVVGRDLIDEMGAAAVALAKACAYVNAGTVEMLVEDDRFYFLEINARLQVEHTVTEEVYGIDLVACQLRIAAGDRLDLTQTELSPRGHAIECRINAEDPGRDFIPTPGILTMFEAPSGPGVRLDAGYRTGDSVPDAYDSLIGKLVVHGRDREEARRRMLRALEELVIEGVATTVPAHRALLQHPEFVAGRHTTRTIEEGALSHLRAAASPVAQAEDVLLVGGRGVRLWNPAMAASATAAAHAGGVIGEIRAPMAGTIIALRVAPGDEVVAGDVVAVLEAMKMETQIVAPADGRVAAVHVAAGDTAAAGSILVELDA